MAYVYILCFRDQTGKPTRYKHAAHYVGRARRLKDRIARHRSRQGARLLQVILDAGLDFEVTWSKKVKTFEEAGYIERWIKRSANARRFCSCCTNRHSLPKLPRTTCQSLQSPE